MMVGSLIKSSFTSSGGVCTPLSHLAPFKARRTRRPLRAAPSTLYELLDVPSSALKLDIRAAYRRLAALYHPDRNKTEVARVKYQAVCMAWEVLSDEELRRQYDLRGFDGLAAKYGQYHQLRDFFQLGRRRARMGVGERGADVFTVVGLELKECVTGVAKVVTVDILGMCASCEGFGTAAGALPEDCDVCRGSGEINRTCYHPGTASPTGPLPGPGPIHLSVCPGCGGKGTRSAQFCRACGGEGRSRSLRGVPVNIPAGVDGSSVLKVKGRGDFGRFGGASGDLFIKFEVYNSSAFERRGDDIFSQLPVPLFDALLGASMQVATARGTSLLTVPRGTQHGDLLRLDEAGISKVKGGTVERGNHIFEVQVAIPSAAGVAPRELELLRRLAELERQRGGVAAPGADDGLPEYGAVFGLKGSGGAEAPPEPH